MNGFSLAWLASRRHRFGQALVRGRRHPRRAEVRPQRGLRHRGRDSPRVSLSRDVLTG